MYSLICNAILNFVRKSKINSKTIRLLVKIYPKALEIPDYDGRFPIHGVISDADQVRLFLDIFPDGAKCKDNDGDTPLDYDLSHS